MGKGPLEPRRRDLPHRESCQRPPKVPSGILSNRVLASVGRLRGNKRVGWVVGPYWIVFYGIRNYIYSAAHCAESPNPSGN